MERRPLAELGAVADLQPTPVKPRLSRRERLDRWAELLEQDPDRLLHSLEEIERQAKARRRAMRAENSPLSVAFADPLLRSEGLAGDTLGEASDFFQLSDREAHIVLCSCNGGPLMRAGEAARRVRAIRAPSLGLLYLGWSTALWHS